MGWLFSHYESKKDLANKLVKQVEESKALYLGHSLVGNILYVAIQYVKEEETLVANEVVKLNKPVSCILIYKLEHNRKDYYNWGYKDMDESMHPYYYACPLKLLQITDLHKPDNENSKTWREEVVKYHKAKKELKAITYNKGDIVRFKEKETPYIREDIRSEDFTVYGKRGNGYILQCSKGLFKVKKEMIYLLKAYSETPE